MTWLQRYRLRNFLRGSVWLPPLLGLLGALAVNRLMLSADHLTWWQPRVGVEGSRILLTALASSLLTFIVFVFSILLLAVQLASAQLTPRVIAHFYRNWVLRIGLSVFVFVFMLDLAVVVRIDESVGPQWELRHAPARRDRRFAGPFRLGARRCDPRHGQDCRLAVAQKNA